MTADVRAALVKLGDSDLTVANPDEDIRGRQVIDQAGDEIGKVDALLLDERENKIRFMDVESGGFLGIGAKHFLLPIDAVTRIDEDHVHISHSREHVAGAPDYDPALVREPDFFDRTYSYYGYSPYWAPGYAYPGFPYYI